MPLSKKQKAPAFALSSTSGEEFSLEDHLGTPLILFFYPKNFTSVCTKEVCEFRDAFAEFRDLNITVIGVSQDSIKSHLEFKKANKLPFELLSDPKGKVAKTYNATIPVLGMNRRITYLLDAEHRIKGVFEDMFSAGKHVQAMINEVKG